MGHRSPGAALPRTTNHHMNARYEREVTLAPGQSLFRSSSLPQVHVNRPLQPRRKHFGSGAAIGTKKTAGGLGGAVSLPAGPGQSPGGGPGGEAPGSSVNLGILKP